MLYSLIMYKYFIIVIALMFISAGGYYINVAGGGIMSNIITGNITSQDMLAPVNIYDVPGVYVCSTASTCKSKYVLILKDDKTAELVKSPLATKQDAEQSDITELESDISVTELGVWDLEIKNTLVITLSEKSETKYSVPQKIVVKNVRSKTLSKISYTKSNYKDMHNPIFFKQE